MQRYYVFVESLIYPSMMDQQDNTQYEDTIWKWSEKTCNTIVLCAGYDVGFQHQELCVESKAAHTTCIFMHFASYMAPFGSCMSSLHN